VEGTPFGRYQLLGLVGRGGMGEVWRAHDSDTNRTVALKLLPESLAHDPKFEARFRREAQAAAGLNDPHVVPIHHFGEIDGRLYVDMRLIEGRDLLEIINGRPMDPRRAVGIVEQIAGALDAAHRIGLVHRDVKPSNILVGEKDFAYLIDFGIARAEGDSALTSAGSTLGTWAYMAPERFETGDTSPSGDVYALTCVLYESLTGRRPYEGTSPQQVMSAHMHATPPRPTSVVPRLAPGLDAVVATGMAKSRAQRFSSAGDLGKAARLSLEVPATAVGRQPQPQPLPPPTRPALVSQQRPAPLVRAPSVFGMATSDRRRPRWPWAVVAAGAVAAVTVSVVVAVSPDSEPSLAQPTTTTTTALPTSTSQTTSVPPATTLSQATVPAPVLEGGVTNGPLTFSVSSAETTDVIKPGTSAELRAEGTFVIVRMTVYNATAEKATFLAGDQQLVTAGSAVEYDFSATFELDTSGVVVPVGPHQSEDVLVVFDAPKDVPIEAIRVVGELAGKGTDVPLPAVTRG
jgi:serine/threonine protein kinase